jgi:hypothetical protein
MAVSCQVRWLRKRELFRIVQNAAARPCTRTPWVTSRSRSLAARVRSTLGGTLFVPVRNGWDRGHDLQPRNQEARPDTASRDPDQIETPR